jgi:hypothetical protein
MSNTMIELMTEFLSEFAADNKELFSSYFQDSDDAWRTRFSKMNYDQRRDLVAKTLDKLIAVN